MKKMNLSANLAPEGIPVETVPKKRSRKVKTEGETAEVVTDSNIEAQSAVKMSDVVASQIVMPEPVRDIRKMTCEPNRKLCEAILANAKQTDHGVTYAMIPIDLMDMDYTYQRKSGQYRAIAAAWDAMKCDALTVSYRNNRFYVIDGQNRMKAAYLRGFDSMYCQVYTGLNQEQEAMLFAQQDELSTNVTAKEKLNAFIVGKDAVALAVKEVCDAHNVCWYKRYAADIGALGCPSLAQKIVARDGRQMLDDIFECIAKMHWHDWPQAYSDTIVRALRNVLKQWGDKDKVCSGLEHLSLYMPKQVIGLAQVQYINARGTTEAVVKYFNSLIED